MSAGPYAGGCRGCRSTPYETEGINFHSGFRENGQGGGGGAIRNTIAMHV